MPPSLTISADAGGCWSSTSRPTRVAAGRRARSPPRLRRRVAGRSRPIMSGASRCGRSRPPTGSPRSSRRRTEEAQYSLLWPLASALARGRFGVAEVLGPFTDPAVRAMFERIEIEVDPELTAAFPARRLTAVEIELTSGERLAAGPLRGARRARRPGVGGAGSGQAARRVRRRRAAGVVPSTAVCATRRPSQLLALLARRRRPPMADAPSRLELDGATLAYRQSGAGPDIVWLAAGDNPGDNWRGHQTPAFDDALPQHDLRRPRGRRDELGDRPAVADRRARGRSGGADRSRLRAAGVPRRTVDGQPDRRADRA